LQTIYDKKIELNKKIENTYINEIKNYEKKCREMAEKSTENPTNTKMPDIYTKIIKILSELNSTTFDKRIIDFFDNILSDNHIEETYSINKLISKINNKYDKLKLLDENEELLITSVLTRNNLEFLLELFIESSLELSKSNIQFGFNQVDETGLEFFTHFILKNDNLINNNKQTINLKLDLLNKLLKFFKQEVQIEKLTDKTEMFFSLNNLQIIEKETNDYTENNLAGNNILIVDDNIENLLYFEAVSLQLKINTYKAKDGNEAINLLKNHKNGIKLVLLDYQLPGITGEEVAIKLKKITPDIKIIIISAYEIKNKIDNVDKILRKPIEVEHLKQEIVNLLK
jgi:CheY-like chemotaxis protein